ncbi:MAG: hypothetical protein ABR926_25295 [Streptosporangiaceae bacterium]
MPLEQVTSGIAGVGHISTNLYEDLRKAQNVGVDVKPDRGGPE